MLRSAGRAYSGDQPIRSVAGDEKVRNAYPSLAGVAQLVEQLIRNQQVSGSSPLAGSTFFCKSPRILNALAIQ